MTTRKWTQAWHQQQVNAYSRERPIYELYSRVLRLVLSQACQRYASEGHAFARAKEVASFGEKAIRKFDRYPDPIHQYTDLCGGRVVVLTQDDADRVAQFVKRNFVIDEDNSEDIRTRLKPDQFGYRAIHYVVQMPWVGLLGHGVFKKILDRLSVNGQRDLRPFLKQVGDPNGNRLLDMALREGASKIPFDLFEMFTQPSRLMDPEGAEILRQAMTDIIQEDRQVSALYPKPLDMMCAIGNRKAEIQVQTLLQHAWSAISHDRLYKTNFQPPRELERQFTRVAALLEEGDEQFSRSIVGLQEYQLDYGKYLAPEEIESEIAKWKAVANCEPKNLQVALTIAEYAKAIENWDEIIERLQPFKTEDHRVLRLLGLANSKKHHTGQIFLKNAVQIAPDDSVSLCLLAETYCPGSDCFERAQPGKPRSTCKKALSLYSRAFGEIAPGKTVGEGVRIQDPHSFRRYAECLVCNGSCQDLCALAAPALKAAWEMAYRRSEVHVRAPESLYDMGFFGLLLGWPYDSLGAYTKAVFLSPTESAIEAELHALARLKKAAHASSAPAWDSSLSCVTRFLELARVAKLQQMARQAPAKIAQKNRELSARREELGDREIELQKYKAELNQLESASAPPGQPRHDSVKGWLPEEVSQVVNQVLVHDQELQDARLKQETAAGAVGEARAAVALAEAAVKRAGEEAGKIQRKADQALAQLRKLNLHTRRINGKPVPFGRRKLPVVVLVGGCDPAIESLMQSYAETIVDAFAGFSGIICSAGTRAGIGAIAGDIQERYGKDVLTVGYLPNLKSGKVQKWVVKDDRYCCHIPTQGDDFSPLEPLQYWSDIIASGIPPHEVKVLGINGGLVAALEYRLGLAFDASVAVLEKSGREAAKLLQNEDWGVAERLMVLPPEVPVIRAYVRAGSIQAPRGFDVTESMARRIHEDYRRLCVKQARRDNSSLNDWVKLHPDLQEANFQQARHWADHLQQIGYQVRKQAKTPPLPLLPPEHLEALAEREHARYLIERFLKGWKWGEKKDNDRKINPTLVGWEQLPPAEKEKDRDAARNALKLFADNRFAVFLDPATRTPGSTTPGKRKSDVTK